MFILVLLLTMLAASFGNLLAERFDHLRLPPEIPRPSKSEVIFIGAIIGLLLWIAVTLHSRGSQCDSWLLVPGGFIAGLSLQPLAIFILERLFSLISTIWKAFNRTKK